jgi:hypothetical protein
MAKEIKKRTGKRDKEVKTKDLPERKPELVEPDSAPFDFGGLPQRDLKKSLGCG